MPSLRQLLSGEMPSAELVTALVGLAGRHPLPVIEHCLLPLSAGDRLTCDDLALKLVTDGLQGPHRTQLVRLVGQVRSPTDSRDHTGRSWSGQVTVRSESGQVTVRFQE